MLTRIEQLTCMLIITVFGLTYAFLIPPFEAPDEPAHFARAYGIAEGQFILKDHPRKLIEYMINEFLKRPGRQDLPIIVNIQKLLSQNDERIPNIAYNSSQYSPITYLFHASAIKILMLCSNKIDIGFYLYVCRIISILLFAGLMLTVFKIAQNLSWPFFWIAVTPMALSQASVVNPDGLVYGTTFILLLISIYNGSKRFYAIWIVFSIFFLISVKPPYAPLLIAPLAALFTNKRFDTYKLAWIMVAVATSLVSMILWTYLMKFYGAYEFMMNTIHLYISPAIHPDQQAIFLLNSPLWLFQVIFNTFDLYGSFLLHSFVGILGWLEMPVPAWMVICWFALSTVSILISEMPDFMSYPVAVGWGISTGISGILAALCIVVSIYLVWMPVGESFVHLQGRYFHPIAAAILICLVYIKPFTLSFNISKIGSVVLLSFSVVIHITTFYIIITTYYPGFPRM